MQILHCAFTNDTDIFNRVNCILYVFCIFYDRVLYFQISFHALDEFYILINCTFDRIFIHHIHIHFYNYTFIYYLFLLYNWIFVLYYFDLFVYLFYNSIFIYFIPTFIYSTIVYFFATCIHLADTYDHSPLTLEHPCHCQSEINRKNNVLSFHRYMKRSRKIPTHLDSIETEIHEAENASSIPEDLHLVQLIDNNDRCSILAWRYRK